MPNLLEVKTRRGMHAFMHPRKDPKADGRGNEVLNKHVLAHDPRKAPLL